MNNNQNDHIRFQLQTAVMIATDVASRGLDFSDVDWVVQVDCPASVEDYIHRVGRTARMNQSGHAVLFLTSSQEGAYGRSFTADPRALVDIRTKMQATLSQFPELNQFAQKSLVAYLRSIYMMRNKKVFDVTTIDAAALAASYGLVTVPRGAKDKEDVGGKNSATPRLPKSDAEEEHHTAVGSFDVNEENEDIMVVKKKDVFSLLKQDPEPAGIAEQATSRNKANTKVVTKMSAAKKLLNKKLKVNVRKVYNEEGEPVKVDGVVEKTESAGLDIASAKESIKQSSVEDRKRHKALLKQKKKEEKERLKRKRNRDRGEDLDMGEGGGSGIDSDADLSFLPDPDEVRKRYAEQAPEEQTVERIPRNHLLRCENDDGSAKKSSARRSKLLPFLTPSERFELIEQFDCYLMAVSYIPAGRIAVNEFHRRADDDVIYWKRMQCFQEPSSVTSVAFSPNKPYNVASTSSVRLSLYDTVVCEPINMFSRFKRAVYGVKFRHDGELIAIGGEEGKVRVFDVTRSSGVGKAPLRSIKASQATVRCVEFSSCGKMLYSMASDGRVKQWDIADTGSTPVIDFAAHQDEIRATAISTPNHNLFLTGGYDHKVKLWDSRCANDGPSVEMDAGSPVESVIFLNNEHLIATAAGPVVKIWDIAVGGRLLISLQQHHKTVTSLCLGASGDTLLTGGIDRRVNAIRLLDFSLLHTMSMAAPVLSLAMSGDDQTMAVGMGQLLAIHRRAPEAKSVVRLKVVQRFQCFVLAAPEVQMHRGRNQGRVWRSGQSPHRLSKVDSLLKGYQHAAAIRKMFQCKCYYSMGTHCHSKRRCIYTKKKIVDSTFRYRLKKWVYGNEELDPKVAKLALALKTAVAKELVVQKQLAQTLGALESIINGARVASLRYEPLQDKQTLAEQGLRELTTKQGDPFGLFGQPAIGSVTLDLLDTKG
ncbi:helicase protein [Ostertagia ostertagi]